MVIKNRISICKSNLATDIINTGCKFLEINKQRFSNKTLPYLGIIMKIMETLQTHKHKVKKHLNNEQIKIKTKHYTLNIINAHFIIYKPSFQNK